MGKAAERRRAHRKNYLAWLSRTDQDYFRYQLELRVQSWISEMSELSRKWTRGDNGYQRRIFEILEQAMEIFEERYVSEKYAAEILDTICHECCLQVSKVVDPRLYRLSNTAHLGYKAKKTAKVN